MSSNREGRGAVSAAHTAESVIARGDGETDITPTIHVQSAAADWETRLIRFANGQPKPTFFNAQLALREHPSMLNVLARDVFRHRTVLTAAPPWEMFPNNWQERVWTPEDDLCALEWMQAQFILVPSVETAVEHVAAERKFHPVHDYLDSLEWDRIPRTDMWLIDYLGAPDTPYVRHVGRTFLISAVARVRDPGCQCDAFPIVVGKQGSGKSSTARILFSSDFFTDELGDISNKDSALQLQGIWCCELSELDALSRHEVSKIKAFSSRRVDRLRPPYGKRAIDFPRQSVFIGTTNSATFLKDETGGRRNLPITSGKINLTGLNAFRDQLWAEANALYFAGAAWHIVNPEVLQAAQEEAASRYQEDVWSDLVLGFVAPLSSTTIADILTDAIGMNAAHQGQVEQNRVARICSTISPFRFAIK